MLTEEQEAYVELLKSDHELQALLVNRRQSGEVGGTSKAIIERRRELAQESGLIVESIDDIPHTDSVEEVEQDHITLFHTPINSIFAYECRGSNEELGGCGIVRGHAFPLGYGKPWFSPFACIICEYHIHPVMSHLEC